MNYEEKTYLTKTVASEYVIRMTVIFTSLIIRFLEQEKKNTGIGPVILKKHAGVSPVILKLILDRPIQILNSRL